MQTLSNIIKTNGAFNKYEGWPNVENKKNWNIYTPKDSSWFKIY